jgi:hypothetical protein
MARMALQYTREETITLLMERDGDRCVFPGCEKPFDKGSHVITFDHIYPQYLAKQAGWTREQIDHIDNLQLMGKSCNVIKGHQLPDENGEFQVLRQPKLPKAQRPDLCETCFSGRILLHGEECPDCGTGPQPAVAPAAYQRAPKDCPHSGVFHCWLCYLGFVDRKSALQTLITGE